MEGIIIRTPTKVGRNDKCRCGSGLKYKKCCLGKEEEHSTKKVEPKKTEPKVVFVGDMHISSKVFYEEEVLHWDSFVPKEDPASWPRRFWHKPDYSAGIALASLFIKQGE